MKAKKFFTDLFILAVFSAVVFYVGWMTFRVKPGYCAVMTSKTGGLYEKPIVPGAFTWRWERLLPTNVSLETFDLSPFKVTQVVSGELPSAKTYSGFAAAKADFSYKMKFNFSMSISPEKILSLYKKNSIRTDEDLKEYFSIKAKVAAGLIASSIIENSAGLVVKPSAVSESELLKIIMKSKEDFEGIAFSSVEISDCNIPDFELYVKAKNSYDEFLNMLEKKLESQAEKNAENYLETDRTLKQFEKIGELMKTYPHIQEMFKTGDAAALINALKTVK